MKRENFAKFKMSVSHLVCFSILLVFVNTIYVPSEDANRGRSSNVGIKSLAWQSNNRQTPSITVHHNYSKVYLSQPNQSAHNYSSSSIYSQQNSRTPKINDNVEQFIESRPETVEQAGVNFNQHTQNFNEQSFNSSTSSHRINDQLEEFTNTNQQFSQNSQNLGRQYKNVDQQNVNYLSTNLHQSNDQLGPFSNTNQQFNQHVNIYDQQVDSLDGTRVFTNAHSSGYPQEKPEKLRQSIHFNPEQTRYVVREKIEVYKKCPTGATGQFVYDMSCNQFLNCWKGRGYVQNCAPGTLFNPETLECDFKDKVTCVTGPRENAFEKRKPLSEALQAKCPQGFSGIIPHYTNCSKFINCNNGVEVIMDCAPGTLFDVKSNTCDFPYKALCVGGSENQESIIDIDENQGFTNKLVIIQPHNRNITYQLHTQNVNDQLQELTGGQNVYLASASGSQNLRGGRIYRVSKQQSINDHLGEFASSNQNTYGVNLNPSRYKPGQTTANGTQVNGFYVTKPWPTTNISQQQNIGSQHSHEEQPFGSNQQITGNRPDQNQYPTTRTHTQDGVYNGRWAEQNQYNQQNRQNQQNIQNLSPKCSPGASGLYPHPTICEKFLNCANGQTFIQDCGPGTIFNPALKVCDFPYNVNCQTQLIGINKQLTDTQETQQTNVGQNGTYYISSNGQIQTQNQIDQQNKNYIMVAGLNEVYSMGLDENYCQNRIGFSIYPQNCSRFLFCDNGKLYIGICSKNMHFNSLKQICEENIDCNSFINQQIGGSSQQTNQVWRSNTQYQHFRLVEIGNEVYHLNLGYRYCENNDGFSVHPNNCSKFLLCSNGRLLLGICNTNTFYNPWRKICESNYNCAQQQTTSQNQNQYWSVNQYEKFRLIEAGSEMNILRLDMNYCQFHDGFSTHPKNCSKFFLCQNGRLLLGICEPQKFFNPATKTCESNYRCKYIEATQINSTGQHFQQDIKWEDERFSIIGADNEISSLNLNINYCKNNDGFSEYPTNCSKFLYCKNDRLYIGVCKFHMIYNQTSKTCDFTSTCIKLSIEIAQVNDIDCKSKQNGLYPHPTICSKFINCINGAKMIHTCAAGTLFNSVSKVCDFSRNVECNNRTKLDTNVPQSRPNQVQWQSQWSQLDPNNQEDQWKQQYWQQQNQINQGQDQWNEQWIDQNKQWLTTQKPIPRNDDETVLTYDQNKKPTNSWPPPFPITDPNADYVFEYNDLVEVSVTERPLKEDCGDNDFHCTKTTCIEIIRVCDGFVDCPDGEDEKNCEKYTEKFTHVPHTKMAVQEKVKYQNFTLTLCAKHCIESKGFTCKAFNFRKMDGACFILTTNVGLSGSLFTLPTYDYYEYTKYSIDCTNKFVCTNQKCIDTKKVCDGVSDCVDRTDEKGCKAEELGYRVQLIGSEKSYQGAVQVTVLGKTGFVCDDMFNKNAANVLCKELGFELGAAEVKGNSYFTSNLTKNNTFYIMDDVVCLGSETSIRDCDFNGWGIHNCMEKEVVGVVCKTPEERCAKDYWKCETVNECVPLSFVCDGVDDCADKSDEGSQYCDAPIELRLVGGRTNSQGRVEIKYHGIWGTVCDDDFNDDAAKVICKYLGHSGPAHVKKEAYFGQGSGPIWLDQIFCQGNESSLQDCIRWDWGEHNCEHSEDVGVMCNDYQNAESPRSAKLPPTSQVELLPNRCGYRNDDIFLENDEVHFRVVKGSVARKGQYPWQASLRVKGKTKANHWCGAVIISSRFILTAAHCLHGFTKGAYVVVAGDYDVNEDEGTEQEAYIDEFYIHEDFRKGTRMNNDIALIRLKENGLRITKDVQPICLPNADFIDEAGLNCTISGFGSVQSGKAVASKELRAAWIPIQPLEICKMPHIYGKTITEGMFCAGLLDGGVDACDGDSGGPLACLQNGLFTLVGTTSWGQHCGEANKPGVYVKIAYYRNWIDQTMKKHSS